MAKRRSAAVAAAAPAARAHRDKAVATSAKAPAKRKRANAGDEPEAEVAPQRRPPARAARASHAPAPAAPAPRAAKRRQSEAEPARAPQAKRVRAAKVGDRGLEALPPVAHASHLKARKRWTAGAGRRPCSTKDTVITHCVSGSPSCLVARFGPNRPACSASHIAACSNFASAPVCWKVKRW